MASTAVFRPAMTDQPRAELTYIDSDDEYACSAAKATGIGGLSAAELPEEKLFPGDTIEYFSMAFVFGDPRGYHLAKVLKVDHTETEYPIRLDTQELLPCTQMIKRNLTRRGEEIEFGGAVWRKIRTFELVDGEIKGKTRADRLNEGIKRAQQEAFDHVFNVSAKDKSASSKPTPKLNFFSAAPTAKTTQSTPKISNFFTAIPKEKPRHDVDSEPHRERDSSVGLLERHSKKLDRDSREPSKQVTKRARIELSPPNRRPDFKSNGATSSSKPLSPKTDRRSSGGNRDGFRRGDEKPKAKNRLQSFVHHVEETKDVKTNSRDERPSKSHRRDGREKRRDGRREVDTSIDLDTYLNRKQQQPKSGRRDDDDDIDGSDDDVFERSSTRLPASRDEHRPTSKKPKLRTTTMNRWIKPHADQKPPPPPKRESSDPIARLNFIMTSKSTPPSSPRAPRKQPRSPPIPRKQPRSPPIPRKQPSSPPIPRKQPVVKNGDGWFHRQ